MVTELGILAYGLYLFHQPVLGLVYGLTGKATPKIASFSAVGLTLLSGFLVFAIARLSWLYFEKPLINKGHRYRYRLERDCIPVVMMPDSGPRYEYEGD